MGSSNMPGPGPRGHGSAPRVPQGPSLQGIPPSLHPAFPGPRSGRYLRTMPDSADRRRRIPWREAAILFLVATAFGVFASTQHFLGMRMGGSNPTWSHAVSAELPAWYLWLAAFPAVAWFVSRYRLERRIIVQRVLLYVGFALLILLLHTAANLWIHRLTGFSSTRVPYWIAFGRTTPWAMTSGLLSYGAIRGLALARDYYLRYRERPLAAAELSARLAEAQLAALRMQLNPHFLFNTLNSVAMLVRRQRSDEAVRMVAGLRGLLRTALEASPPQEVPLREELAFCQRYLEIERIRFSDRLQVDVQVPEETLDAFVPHLVLQPLVENALKHGIAQRSAAGRLEVRAERRGDTLVLRVQDDGPGPDDGRPAREGVGLRNTRSRLARLYGAAQSLSLAPAADQGTVATVELPFHLGPVPIGYGAG